MTTADEADRWFSRYGLSDIPRFSDPQHLVYEAFDLRKGSIVALSHPSVAMPWIKSVLQHGFGWQGSHWNQLNGMFLVHRGAILGARKYQNSSIRPDYLSFVREHLVSPR